MAKNTEVTQKTRQNLMNAFWELYQAKRIEKITIKEITALAGYNRGTFYEYFTDVYQLLDELEKELIPAVEEIPTMSEALPLESFLQLYEKHNRYYTVLLGENGDPAFAAKIKAMIKASLLPHFSTPYEEPAITDYKLEYTLSAIVGTMNYWYSNGQNLPKEQLVELLLGLSKHGMRSNRKNKQLDSTGLV